MRVFERFEEGEEAFPEDLDGEAGPEVALRDTGLEVFLLTPEGDAEDFLSDSFFLGAGLGVPMGTGAAPPRIWRPRRHISCSCWKR